MQSEAMGAMGVGRTYGAFPCVRLSNLPYDACEENVAHWLSNVVPLDILMVTRGGRPAGEALVVLADPMQQEITLSRNNSAMARSVVSVSPATKQDYYREIMAMGSEPLPADAAMLHASAAAGAIGGAGLQMPLVMPGGGPGAGMSSGMQGALLGHAGGGVGGSLGAALLPYALPNAALQHVPHRPMFPGQHLGQAFAQQRAPLDASQPSSMVKLRGLPFSATANDIANWFNTGGNGMFSLTADSVVVLTNANGRSTGQAFVEFPNPAEAEAAMFMDRQMFGNRYVELFTSSTEEMQRATGHPPPYY